MTTDPFVSPLRVFTLATAVMLLAGCAAQQKETVADASRASSEPGPKASSTTIKDGAGRSMAELFQGKFAGVQVFQAEGGGIQIRIRNSGALLGEIGEPLYVVDGLPVQSGQDGLVFIDPNTIAKIEVLKDIGSTAMYGMQAAHGVIRITTKRGK